MKLQIDTKKHEEFFGFLIMWMISVKNRVEYYLSEDFLLKLIWHEKFICWMMI